MRGSRINAIYEGMAENCGFSANRLENSTRKAALCRGIGKPTNAQIIAELTRAKCVFQLATICAVLKGEQK